VMKPSASRSKWDRRAVPVSECMGASISPMPAHTPLPSRVQGAHGARAWQGAVSCPGSEPVMSLTFYYAPMSTATVTQLVIEELALPCEKIRIDFTKQETHTPAYLKLNP